MTPSTSLRFCLIFLGLLVPASSGTILAQGKNRGEDYRNPKLPVEARAEDLLKRMTLEEKLGQLQCEIRDVEGHDSIITKGIGNLAVVLRRLTAKEASMKANRIQKLAMEKTRLGIPIIIHDEALHGLIGVGATSFPQAIGLAATWDPGLVGDIARVIGEQARTRGIRQVLSPVINIARDVRWGRVEETYGEDPFLTSMMGVAFCKGIESRGVITTPKHFAANVGDGGRDSHPIHFSERLLREIYFPAFKACFTEAHAGSVMAAYNSLDGLPCSANHWLLTDILRREWSFDGFVVSDYGSVSGIMDMHEIVSTAKEGAKKAIEAGLDVELPGVDFYGKPLLDGMRDASVARSTLDTAVGRLLRAKFRLGMFEHPYVSAAEAERINDTQDQRALALRAARESIVLLKNENNALPLSKNLKSIAVIGPTADVVRLGGYRGSGMKVVTVLEGIKNKISGSTSVRHAQGCDLGGTGLPSIPFRYLMADGSGTHGLRGEYYNTIDLSGKPALQRIDPQINFDWGRGSPAGAIHTDSFSVRWTGKLIPPATGRYKLSAASDDGVRLFIDGKKVVESWFDRSQAADYVTMNLDSGRAYDIRIDYYENAGSAVARLGWDFSESGDTALQHAVSLAKQSDAAVIVTGIIEGEGYDRADLGLPGKQEDLIRAVAATGVPTAVVLLAGSAVTMGNWMNNISAIVDGWYGGEEGGNAIADVLFGDYNPGGRLPITFPQYVGQAPLYYSTKPSGRGYDYATMSGKPLFAFGYGLSYTTFSYTNLQISPRQSSSTDTVTVSCDVQNTGNWAGDEVAQCYFHDIARSVIRPLKELKAFQRVTLRPGEKKSIAFRFSRKDLAFYNRDMQFTVEPGTTHVMIGGSSEDTRLEGEFAILR